MRNTALPTSSCPECKGPLTDHEWMQDHIDSYLGEDSSRIFIERSCPRCNWSLIATLTKGAHKKLEHQQLQLAT